MCLVKALGFDKIQAHKLGGMMGRVIDFLNYFNEDNRPDNKDSNSKESAPLNFTQIRDEKITEERRKVKRIILTEFLGGVIIVPGVGLKKVNIFDISEGGLSFETEPGEGQFNVHEQVALRIYFNHEIYLPLTVKITNIKDPYKDGTLRHGGEFLYVEKYGETMKHFVKFMENVSSLTLKDTGDLMIHSQ